MERKYYLVVAENNLNNNLGNTAFYLTDSYCRATKELKELYDCNSENFESEEEGFAKLFDENDYTKGYHFVSYWYGKKDYDTNTIIKTFDSLEEIDKYLETCQCPRKSMDINGYFPF